MGKRALVGIVAPGIALIVAVAVWWALTRPPRPDHAAIVNAVVQYDMRTLRRAAKGNADFNFIYFTDEGDRAGLTPLTTAAVDGNFMASKLMLEYGADPNFPDAAGVPPLMYVAMRGKSEITNLLLAAGADPHFTMPEGRTMLHEAAYSGNGLMIKLFLDRGLNPNAVSKFRGTPLHAAARQGHAVAVRILLDAGADASIAVDQRGTPLEEVNDLIRRREQGGNDGVTLEALQRVAEVLNHYQPPVTRAAPPTTAPAP